MSKTARQLSIVVAFLMLFGGAYMFRHFKNQKAPPKRKPPKKELLRVVATLPVEMQNQITQLDVQGRLVAFNKIDVIAEVSGRMTESAQAFKVGSYFKKGDALLVIDDAEPRLSLLAQKASLMNAITQMMPDLKIDYPDAFQDWKTYLDQFDVKQSLRSFPETNNEQTKYYITSRNLHSQFYTIKSLEERLSKYRVIAPFSGVLTQTSINTGSLVRSGQKMGELMNTNNYELEASIRLTDLKYIKSGSTVQLYSTDMEGAWRGKVKRVSDQIDPNTQTVIAYIGVTGKNLREGMYLRGTVNGKSVADAMEIPRDLLVNDNSIFTINPDSTLQLIPIKVENIGEDKALVSGLNSSAILLGKMFPGAYNGQKVVPENNSRSTAIN